MFITLVEKIVVHCSDMESKVAVFVSDLLQGGYVPIEEFVKSECRRSGCCASQVTHNVRSDFSGIESIGGCSRV